MADSEFEESPRVDAGAPPIVTPHDSATEASPAHQAELPLASPDAAFVAAQAAALLARAMQPGSDERAWAGATEGRQPSAAPQRTNLEYSDAALARYLTQHGLKSEDFRSRNGALWVNLDRESGEQARQLRAWGFRYRAGRGWWKT